MHCFFVVYHDRYLDGGFCQGCLTRDSAGDFFLHVFGFGPRILGLLRHSFPQLLGCNQPWAPCSSYEGLAVSPSQSLDERRKPRVVVHFKCISPPQARWLWLDDATWKDTGTSHSDVMFGVPNREPMPRHINQWPIHTWGCWRRGQVVGTYTLCVERECVFHVFFLFPSFTEELWRCGTSFVSIFRSTPAIDRLTPGGSCGRLDAMGEVRGGHRILPEMTVWWKHTR